MSGSVTLRGSIVLPVVVAYAVHYSSHVSCGSVVAIDACSWAVRGVVVVGSLPVATRRTSWSGMESTAMPPSVYRGRSVPVVGMIPIVV